MLPVSLARCAWAAIYWARPRVWVYAATGTRLRMRARNDDLIYREINLPVGQRQIPFELQSQKEAAAVFEQWKRMGG